MCAGVLSPGSSPRVSRALAGQLVVQGLRGIPGRTGAQNPEPGPLLEGYLGGRNVGSSWDDMSLIPEP